MATVIKKYDELNREPMIGDRVLIVSKRTGLRWNSDCLMDKYLSSVMTVRRIARTGHDFILKMHEDEHDPNAVSDGWSWFHEMIEGVIIDEIEEDTSTWTDSFEIDDLLT